jgi:hypothetical protein
VATKVAKLEKKEEKGKESKKGNFDLLATDPWIKAVCLVPHLHRRIISRYHSICLAQAVCMAVRYPH